MSSLTQVPQIVTYVRISSDVTQTGLGVARQQADCEALISSNHITGPSIVVVDNDVSAYNRNKPRPGWRQVTEMIKNGEVATLVAYNSDRLYRRLEDLESLVTLFEAHPIPIRTATSGEIDLATADGRMHARILATVAQHESERKAERLARKHTELAERGRWKGGPRPFGYEKDGVTIRPVEADAARTAATRILAGESVVDVARWVSQVVGRPIHPSSLKRSLCTAHIAGWRTHMPTTERQKWQERRRRGEVTGEEPAHLVVTAAVKGEWPPILDQDTWQALRARFRKRERHTPPRRSMLAGILECGLCGHPLGWGENTMRKYPDFRFGAYRCGPSYTENCGGVAIRSDDTDAWVASIMRGAAQGREVPSVRDDSGNHSEQLQRALMARLDDLADAFGAGELSRDQHRKQREKIMTRLAALETDASDTTADRRRREDAWTVLSAWDSAPKHARTEAIRAVVKRMVVFPSPLGRGHRSPPECRIAIVWADDPRDWTTDELRNTLVPPPPPLTDAEKKAIRNRKAREKRAALRQARQTP